jgi:2-keto-myo-inositol isomerase
MPDFIYCLNTSTIRPASLPDKIRIAGEAGYGAIELWHDDVDAWLATGGTMADLKKQLADRKLVVPSMIYLKGWFETTGAEHATMLSECARRMEQAAEIGAAICVAGPPAGKADFDLGVRNYRELLELGRQIGVRPAFEFLGFVGQYHTIELVRDALRATKDPDACTVVDPFHLWRGGSGIEGFAKAGLTPREIGILHFNDTLASPPREQQHDEHRVLPGEGNFDLKRYVQIARDLGYRGALSLELFNPQLWKLDPLEVARKGLALTRKIVEG